MGTSTGIALPRTSIGNLCLWVPTYIFRFRSYLVTNVGRILDAKGGCVNFR
jgi:hypothetical protein